MQTKPECSFWSLTTSMTIIVDILHHLKFFQTQCFKNWTTFHHHHHAERQKQPYPLQYIRKS
jgi:hypothetical protein